MIVRNCMKLASFRAGFRAVKAFTGAAICTSCVVVTKSCPGVLRCFKATYAYPSLYQAATRHLSTGFFSSVFRKAKTENDVDSHLADTLDRFLDHEENFSVSLEEITRKQKRRMKAMQKARGAREFLCAVPGGENRTLSWDTIDQIRYLWQESPSEWSIAALARSFNVSEEVIAKVLKSKYTPSSKVRQKQDMVAAENSGSQMAVVRTEALVESGTQHDQEVWEQHQPSDLRKTKNEAARGGEHGATAPSHSSVHSHSENHQRASWQHQQNMTKSSEQDYQSQAQCSSPPEDSRQVRIGENAEVEFTFGRFDFENVDSLMGQVKLKPQVIRRGRNFYNENGEFLYRV